MRLQPVRLKNTGGPRSSDTTPACRASSQTLPPAHFVEFPTFVRLVTGGAKIRDGSLPGGAHLKPNIGPTVVVAGVSQPGAAETAARKNKKTSCKSRLPR